MSRRIRSWKPASKLNRQTGPNTLSRVKYRQHRGDLNRAYVFAQRLAQAARRHHHGGFTQVAGNISSSLRMSVPSSAINWSSVDDAILHERWLVAFSLLERRNGSDEWENAALWHSTHLEVSLTLGLFDTAWQHFTQLRSAERLWSTLDPQQQSHCLSLAARCAWHRGDERLMDLLVELTPAIQTSPTIWLSYWWCLAHMAVARRPERLTSIAHTARQTFLSSWSEDFAIVWRWLTSWGDPFAPQELGQYFLNPDVMHQLGRSLWLCGVTDWINMSWRQESEPTARRLTEQWVAWASENGYPGWAQHWDVKWLHPSLTLSRPHSESA